MAAERSVPAIWLRVVLVTIVLAGVFFRFYNLDRKVYWEDEILGTVHMLGYTEGDIVRSSPHLVNVAGIQAYFRLPDAASGRADHLSDTVRSLALEDPQHPPLYYVTGHLWAKIFGSSATAIRSLSAAFGVLALPAMFWLCLELFGSMTAGWIGVALLALSPFAVLYSQEAREYSLWTLAILVLSAVFLRAVRLMNPRWWLAYGVMLTVSLYIYPLSITVALGQGLFLLATARSQRRTLIAYLVSLLAAGALFAPWARVMSSSQGVGRGMHGILSSRLSPVAIVLGFLRDVRGIFVDLGSFRLGHFNSTAINFALLVLTTALVAYALYALVRFSLPRVWAFILLTLCLPALPLLLHDVVFGGELVLQTRYFVPAYLGIELAVVALFLRVLFEGAGDRLARPLWWSAAVALLCGELLSCVVSSQAETWWNKDFEVSRSVAEVVNHADHPLVVSDIGTSRTLGLSYYLDPDVALRLYVSCEQCAIARPLDSDSPIGAAGHDDIFLLGASAQMQSKVLRDDGSAKARFRQIGVSIYPQHPTKLDLFLPN